MDQPEMQSINLEALPTFSNITSPSDIENGFYSSARALMLEHCLTINDKCFFLTALELYLKLHKRQNIWWDAATDKDEDAKEQYNRGTWYVRRKKGQNRWRIDITAGNADEDIQAGILIRQLNGKGGQQPGPATALHQIVRGAFNREKFTQEQLDLLNEIHGKRIDGSDGSPLVLKRLRTPIQQPLAKGKRFNISSKLTDKIRGAPLRVSIWRKDSSDKPIPDSELAATV